jgi:hypothetical protein
MITGTIREPRANLDFRVMLEPRNNEQRDQQLPVPVTNIHHHDVSNLAERRVYDHWYS